MKRKVMLLLTCLLVGIGLVTAQTSTVTGIVISSDDGEPVVGASVLVEGTTLGGTTGIDGKFTINNVPSSAKTLRVTYIGMQSQSLPIIRDKVMRIALKTDAELLDEVVVTAMGIKRSEKSLGFSASSVKGDAISSKRTNDIMSSLSGKVAGVQISNTSSDPGASNSVIIRGVSSLSGNNQPLYVIDGVPLNNSSVYSSSFDGGYDFGNGSNAVNPDDVESMTILKGAAATALYGNRASGGVILITTKSGKKQKKGLGVEYNGGIQWESVLRIPQMQNEFGMGWYGDHTEIENGSWGPRLDGSMQLWGNVYNNSQKMKPFVAMEDNIKDFFNTGLRYNNSVSFNGATDKSDFYVSLSQISDDGMIPTDADSYDKYTFSARGSHKAGNLTFSTSLNYAYQKNSFVTTGQSSTSMYNSIMQTPRDVSIIGMKNLDDPFNMPGYYYTPYGVTNPYYILENYQNEYESERFYGKFQLDYDFLKYFKFTYRFGLDTSTGHHNTGSPNLSAMFAGTPNWSGNLDSETGSVSQQTTRRREINQDLLVTFNMPVKDFQINAIAGFNGNERQVNYLYSAVSNLTIPTWYNLSNSSEIPSTSQYKQLRRIMGLFGQAEVSWKDMLFVTMTARNDWSSTLPKGNRSFFYPGITGSFLFSELLNDDTKKILTFGKVRAAWGKTGNDATPYMTQPVYAQGSASSSGWGSSSFPFSKVGVNAYSAGNVLGSNNLSPEMTTEMELGLNMAFFTNRISFDVAYYNRNTDKQIFSLNMDPATGYTAQNMNLGKVRNRGVELLVSVTPVMTKDFRWDISWNWTKNWSKVVDLPDELGGISSITGFSGGTQLYAIEGEELGVFKAVVPKRDPNGNIIVNSSTGLPVEADEQIVGSMNSKYQMGFSTTFSYKGISLSADLDVRKGGLMYSRTKSIAYFTGNAIQTAYNDRNPFVIPNSVNEITLEDGTTSYVENSTALNATQIYNYWEQGGSDLASGFLVDKSYVKLRSVVLSWELPAKWLAKTPLNGVRLSAFGNNLFLWTPSENTFMDPESTTMGNDLEGNFGEFSSNPSSRKFGFNVMVKF